MRVVVQKYGGSSVTDLEKVGQVADRIAETARDGTRVVVVVSAMGNTTDQLLALARGVSARPDRRELDMLLSVGERITMALLAMALRERGLAARSLTGSQSGIITDEAHADARVVEVRSERVRAHLERGEVVIVAGFQGVSREREVTTLGRGGSDTTAVVLAAALGAEYCEICSDVDGVWSADPRVVPEARRLDTLGLDEGLSLARAGAKVLFEDALRYARDHGVQLRATASFGPGAGTRLVAEQTTRAAGVAVTSDDQIARIDADLDSLVGVLAGSGARVRRLVGTTAWVDLRNVHGALPDGLVVDRGIALVSVVGSGLGGRLDLLKEGLRAVPSVRYGAEGDTLWFEVARQAMHDAVRTLHGLLVTPP